MASRETHSGWVVAYSLLGGSESYGCPLGCLRSAGEGWHMSFLVVILRYPSGGWLVHLISAQWGWKSRLCTDLFFLRLLRKKWLIVSEPCTILAVAFSIILLERARFSGDFSYLSCCPFWVAALFSSTPEIYEAKRKPWGLITVTPQVPGSLAGLPSPVPLSASYVHLMFDVQVFKCT